MFTLFNLRVSGALPGTIHFVAERPDSDALTVSVTSELTGAALPEEPETLRELLPDPLVKEIQQAVISVAGTTVLVVETESPALEVLPWEYLPSILGSAGLFVVRRLPGPPRDPLVVPAKPLRLLGAGWSGVPTFDLPGIREELAAFTELGTGSDMKVRVLSERTPVQLATEYANFDPHILHLAPAAVQPADAARLIESPQIYVSDSEGGRFLGVSDLMASLQGKAQPRLVVLNSCHAGYAGSGPSALRVISGMLDTLAVGWLGSIMDQAALDFSRFLYSRIADGESVLQALLSYRSLSPPHVAHEQASRGLGVSRRWRAAANSEGLPVVWTAAPEFLTTPLTEAAAPDERPGQPEPGSRAGSAGTGQDRRLATADAAPWAPAPSVTIEFEPQPWLNPALLRNGRQPIQRLALATDAPLDPLVLSITCDTGNGTSCVRQSLRLERGLQPVAASQFEFPVLYELIEATVPRRRINFTVSCTWRGLVVAEVTQSALWMGRAEWLDRPDTWHFVPAFVNPYCDGVLDAVDKADGILKQIDSPSSTFCAYQLDDSAFVSKQAEAIFNSLRDCPLRYISPPPLPVYTPGEQYASGQRVRTPDEVMQRRRGTCHDLAILFASCLEQIQVYPLMVLIRGHTFCGFWLDQAAHDRFWREASGDPLRRPQDPGRAWTMRDVAELKRLVESDHVLLVDVTLVTDPTAVFREAVQAGSTLLGEDAPAFDVAIDIQASRRSIQPL